MAPRAICQAGLSPFSGKPASARTGQFLFPSGRGHLEDGAEFFEPEVDATQAQPKTVALTQPVLNFLGLAPLAGFQAGAQLVQNPALDLRTGAATARSHQQLLLPARFESSQPVEKLASADASLLGDLRRRVLSGRRKSQGQKALPVRASGDGKLAFGGFRQHRGCIQSEALRHEEPFPSLGEKCKFKL